MRGPVTTLSSTILFLVILFAGLFFIPWGGIDWGTIRLGQEQTITVTGSAKQSEINQIASFTASVTAFSAGKDDAVAEVNEKMSEVVERVKQFGVPDGDIKTQSASTREQINSFREVPTDERWVASNSLSITLKDVDRAGEMLDLLNSTGANSISGPSFRVDDADEVEISLLEDAIENAREKAEKLASVAGRRLGKVVSLSEGTASSPPMFRGFALESAALGAPVEPGSSEVTKAVTVTFELK